MLEPAPGRASTTTCWPSVLLMASPTSRAVISAAEPGGKPMIRPMGRDGWLSAFACGTAATAVSTSVSAKTAMRCMAVLPLDAACVVQQTGCRQTSRFACALRDWRNDPMLIDRKSDGDVACCHTTSVPGLIGRAGRRKFPARCPLRPRRKQQEYLHTIAPEEHGNGPDRSIRQIFRGDAERR